jgi:hypothetical protein
MSIRHARSNVAAGALAAIVATAPSEAAHAQANVLKECGVQFQAAKVENVLKGQGWHDYLKACRARLAEQPAPVGAAATSGAPNTQSDVLKECGSQYQTAKAANRLEGRSWQDFLNACRTHVAEQPTPDAPTATPLAPAAAPVASVTPPQPTAEPVALAPAPTTVPAVAPAKPISDGKIAERSRKKWCVAEWKAQKAELKKTSPELKWTQYWNECNKRLKTSLQ